MKAPCKLLSLTLLVALAACASARQLKEEAGRPDNIWYELVDLGGAQSYTRTAIQTAGMQKTFEDPSFKHTFFAMDNSAWEDIARSRSTTAEVMVSEQPELVTEILQNHLLVDPRSTSFWPAAGEPPKFVETLNDGHLLELTTNEYGYKIIHGWAFAGELSTMPNLTNIDVGKSVIHVIHDVDPLPLAAF